MYIRVYVVGRNVSTTPNQSIQHKTLESEWNDGGNGVWAGVSVWGGRYMCFARRNGLVFDHAYTGKRSSVPIRVISHVQSVIWWVHGVVTPGMLNGIWIDRVSPAHMTHRFWPHDDRVPGFRRPLQPGTTWAMTFTRGSPYMNPVCSMCRHLIIMMEKMSSVVTDTCPLRTEPRQPNINQQNPTPSLLPACMTHEFIQQLISHIANTLDPLSPPSPCVFPRCNSSMTSTAVTRQKFTQKRPTSKITYPQTTPPLLYQHAYLPQVVLQKKGTNF